MLNARSDVVGSLLRPPELLAAQKQFTQGAITPVEFKRIEDSAVDQAIALQEEVGLEVVTDGEMRRQSFQSQMTAAVEGFGEHSLDAFLWGDWHADPQIGNWVLERPSNLGVVGKLRRRRATSRQRSSPVCVRALAASPRLRCLLRPLGEFLVAQALRPRLSYTRVLLERCCSNPP